MALNKALSKTRTRKMIFDRLEIIRPGLVGKMTVITGASFEWLEARLKNIIDEELRIHPTVGKTLDLGAR